MPSLNLDYVRAPYGSSLPLTLGLVSQCEQDLLSDVEGTPKSWAFLDRLVALLSPHLVEDIRQFYSGRGEPLDEIYPPNEIAGLDRVMLRKLARLIRDQHPEVAARVLDD